MNSKDRGVDLCLFNTGGADPVNDDLKSQNQYSHFVIILSRAETNYETYQGS